MPSLKIPADLDRRLDLDRVAAGRDVPGLDRPDVDLLEAEVAPGRDPDQVCVGAVGAGTRSPRR